MEMMNKKKNINETIELKEKKKELKGSWEDQQQSQLIEGLKKHNLVVDMQLESRNWALLEANSSKFEALIEKVDYFKGDNEISILIR